jgi:hypothetical protein
MAREFREEKGAATPALTEAMKELKETWRAMVPTFRMLCLSEINDAMPMWYHYAEKYQGVVLEFCAVEEVDGAFQVARPVLYQDTPSISRAKVWVSCILHEGEMQYRDLFVEYLCVKTAAWSYEREWRIPIPGRRPDDSELFGDYGYHPRELTAIFLGPKCTPEDRVDLLALLGHGLEHVKAYEMVFDTQQARVVARSLTK